MTAETNAPWTVLRLLEWTKDYLAKARADAPRLQAEMLLAHVLGCQRIQLYTRFDYQPTTEQLEQFRALVRRAHDLEPVAYLVGHKEFYSLDFKVTRDVLVPRAETERLVDLAKEHLKGLDRPGTHWDAYTGSGCIAIAVAHGMPTARVLGTDVSEPAIAVARENAQQLNVEQRVMFHVGDRLHLPPEAAELAPFDVLTANPPYIAPNQGLGPGVEHEPPVALFGGCDGLEFLRDTIANAHRYLRNGGLLALEYGYAMADAVAEMVVANPEFHPPKILLDHQGIERMVVVYRR